MQDVAIFYYGGCGGFFALHLLMLSGEFQCVWDSDSQDWDDIFQKQWQVKQITNWKNTETWVDNTQTQASDFPRKVFFVVNPTAADFDRFNAVKVVVFTDADTQWLTSTVKQCFLFTHQTMSDKATELFIQSYNNVRGADWPTVNQASDYQNLPDSVKQEISDVYGLDWLASEDSIINHYRKETLPTVNYQGIDIFEKYKNIIDIAAADFNFLQQELVQTQGRCLYDALGLTWTPACADFTEKYISLHSDSLKERFKLKLR